jgi:hypothetical protein
MSKLQEVASATAINYGELTGNKQAALDPATISAFKAIISEIISRLMECRASSGEAVKVAKSPGVFQRVALRRITRDNLGEDFREHGKEVMEAVLKTGSSLKEDDYAKLYKEVD